MRRSDSVVATIGDHAAADAAIKMLAASGFAIRSLIVVGKGYHTEEKVVGFYTTADRVKFWGSRGAMWGGLWGRFFGGLFMTVPVIGHVIVLGYLAAAALSAIDGAVVTGGLSALGAAIVSIGVPQDCAIDYEACVRADGFLVMAHGTPNEMTRAHAILGTSKPSRLDRHTDTGAPPIAQAAE